MQGTPVIYNLQAVPRGTLFIQNRRFAHGLQPGKQAQRCGTIFSIVSYWGFCKASSGTPLGPYTMTYSRAYGLFDSGLFKK